MSEIVDASAPSVDETGASRSNHTNAKTGRSPRWHYLLDACIIIAMGAILFWGASSQFSNKYNDVTRYQCYDISFWQGNAALLRFSAGGVFSVLTAPSRPRPAAIVFAFYLVRGSWATALGRFDLVPAGLTLGAVILAARARWNWAYVLIALATLLKLYPAILIPVFLIAQQTQISGSWKGCRRWQGLALFLATIPLVTQAST